MLELLIHQPIFIGFKADRGLRQRLDALTDSDKQYVADEDPAVLRICQVGEDTYVGKLVCESLTTEGVDDIRRKVLSILRSLGHVLRLPVNLKILACREVQAVALPAAVRVGGSGTTAAAPDPRASVR